MTTAVYRSNLLQPCSPHSPAIGILIRCPEMWTSLSFKIHSGLPTVGSHTVSFGAARRGPNDSALALYSGAHLINTVCATVVRQMHLEPSKGLQKRCRGLLSAKLRVGNNPA